MFNKCLINLVTIKIIIFNFYKKLRDRIYYNQFILIVKTYGLRQISLYLLLLLILTYLLFIFSIFFPKNLQQNKKHSTT